MNVQDAFNIRLNLLQRKCQNLVLSDCAPGQRLDSAEAMSVILSCEQNYGQQNLGSTPNKRLLTFQHVFKRSSVFINNFTTP